MSLLGAAAIGAAGSIVSGAISNKKNRKLAEYAYSKDLEMWNKQNKYNDPSKQMQRLKAAGLNPNLVYGTGTVTGNTSGQMPKYNAPTNQKIEIPSTTDVLGTFAQQKMLPIQVDQAKATIEGTQANTANLAADFIYKQHRAEKEGISKANLQAFETARINLLGTQKSAVEATIEGTKAKTQFQKYQNEFAKHGIQPTDNIILRMMVKKGSNVKAAVQQWIKENKSKTPNNPFKN